MKIKNPMPSHTATPPPPPETAAKTTTTTTKTSRLNRSSVILAITALLKWAHHHPSSPSTIYLILTLKKTPHAGRLVAHKLTLPFPIYPSISLLVPNHVFNNTTMVSIPNVEVRVLPASELSSLAGSRKNNNSCLINCFLAKKSTKSTNMSSKKSKSSSMVSVDMSRQGWREEVERICRTTELCFAKGNCRAVRVGYAEMGKEEALENVVAAVEEAVEFVPRKWRNVRALHIKTPESLALPVYEALGDGHGGGGGNEEEKKSKKRKIEQ